MREVKFRAWDKTVNKMSKVIRITYSDVQHTTVNYQYINDKGKKRDDLSLLDDDGNVTIVLMQYTGLKDKNGKEIYEGDIVTGKLGKIAEVKWLQEHCAYVGYCREDNKYYYLECGNERFENVVIIGNIFENPELLESVE